MEEEDDDSTPIGVIPDVTKEEDESWTKFYNMNGYTALTLIKAYDKAFELGFKIQDISYYKNYFPKTNQQAI